MLMAQIIDPLKRKSKITCPTCGLSYSARDYLILYEAEKLAFFKMKLPNQRKKNYCHDCLYKSVLASMGEMRHIDVKMVTMKDELIVTFYQK